MRDERGYASILVLGLTLIAVAVAGVAVDGTRAFLLRRSLQNAADAAALAAAAEIDKNRLYSSGGGDVAIDPKAARLEAERWLGRRSFAGEAGVVANGETVSVTLRDELDTTFLRIIGIGKVPVAAGSTARPLAGKDGDSGPPG